MPASPGRARTTRTPSWPAPKSLQQAALADAGFAEQREHAPVGPGARERRELGRSADQPRRPHQARRNDGAPRRQRRRAALDRVEQLDRLRRGARAELVLQPPLEGLERRDRGAAVAAQVVQPHQAPLRVLGERIAVDQALRIDQAAGDGAARLALRRRPRQRGIALLVPAGARRLQPARQLGQVREFQRAEELFAPGVLVAGDAGQRRREVGVDIGGQLQRRAAADQRRADVAAHPEQALAQVGVGLPAIDGGPDQRRGALGRLRPVEGQDGEQGGVLRRQADHRARRQANQARHAEKVQSPGAGGRRLGRNGHRGHRQGRTFLAPSPARAQPSTRGEAHHAIDPPAPARAPSRRPRSRAARRGERDRAASASSAGSAAGAGRRRRRRALRPKSRTRRAPWRAREARIPARGRRRR